MNTSKPSMSPILAGHVQAITARSPGAEAIERAQARLESRLGQRKARVTRRLRLGWVGAACAGVAVLALLLTPVFLTHQGTAFAAVQQHLRDFTTLSMTITQRANGTELPTVHVLADRNGNVRTDVGDATSVIVNVDRGTVLTLLHDSHKALRFSIASRRDQVKPNALGWLDAVRQFQGKAKRLPETRIIDGQRTHGWSLHTDGMHIVLWADDAGMPRAVDINGRMRLTQHMTLQLDQPIDRARLSTQLPPGYTLMGSR